MIISGVTLTGVTVVDAPAVTSGLVYYLDIGNTASYSGSGTSITDISGQGLGAGTLYNSPTYTSAGAGSYLTARVPYPIYLPINLNGNIHSIHITIRNQSDQIIDLNGEHITLSLHLKKM